MKHSKHLVIGMGAIGKRHFRLLEEAGEEVIGIDKNDKPDWDVDMAWICTPPKNHLEYAMEAIKRGKIVFIEKPITADLKEAEQIKNAMDIYNNHKVWIACNYRFHPAVKGFRENLGCVGKILYSRIHYSHYLPYQRENWQEYLKDTNILLDVGIHFVDLAQWLFGKVDCHEYIVALVLDRNLRIEDYYDLKLNHEDKYTFIHLDYLRRDKSWGIQVVGNKGSIELISNGKKLEHIELKRYYDGEGVDCFTPTWTLFGNDEMYINQLNYLLTNDWQSNVSEHIEALKICV